MERNDPAAALNKALATCTGRYLHVMENDYIYLDGWDTYVQRCFIGIPKLGQLCVGYGAGRLIGEQCRNLVNLATANVISSSVFRRELVFDHHIRWQNIYKGSMPDDSNFSRSVKDAGWLVAWPVKKITVSVGFQASEFKRDPDYYIRNYRQKLRSSIRGGAFVKDLLRCRLKPVVREEIGRLFKSYWFRWTKRN